jgi:hypothetical protein
MGPGFRVIPKRQAGGAGRVPAARWRAALGIGKGSSGSHKGRSRPGAWPLGRSRDPGPPSTPAPICNSGADLAGTSEPPEAARRHQLEPSSPYAAFRFSMMGGRYNRNLSICQGTLMSFPQGKRREYGASPHHLAIPPNPCHTPGHPTRKGFDLLQDRSGVDALQTLLKRLHNTSPAAV